MPKKIQITPKAYPADCCSADHLKTALEELDDPTLKTLLAVLKSAGMRLSVEPENQVHACSGVGGWLRPIAIVHAVNL